MFKSVWEEERYSLMVLINEEFVEIAFHNDISRVCNLNRTEEGYVVDRGVIMTESQIKSAYDAEMEEDIWDNYMCGG